MDENPLNYLASLETIKWSDKNYNLSTFLDQNGESLPHVVKVIEGFCGVASSCTIDSGQHLILHALHKEIKILAKDSKDYDLFIPQNFQVKVEMVPKHSFEEYSTIRDLLRTFPNYFRVIEDIPSLDITSDTIFQVVRQNTFTNYIECSQVGKDENEGKTKFTLDLQGRFQPLQDSREFFVDEVLMEDCLPVTVHFVKSMNTCSKGNSKVSLDELGNVLLIGQCETESVFATLLNCNGKSLAVFPRNLNITVQPAEVNDDKYMTLQKEIIVNQDKTLKRIQRLNKLGLYQARNPIQQFPLVDILPPIFPKSRAQSVMEGHLGNIPNLMKERSNSTPPEPTLVQPQQSVTMKSPFKRGIKKTPMTGSCHSSNPQTPQQNNIDKKHPTYKPPPIPANTAPPLPLKDKNKSKQSQDSASPPQIETLKQPSPTTPTPPPRRRRKTQKKKTDVPDGIIDDEGYVKMNPSDEIKISDEYEQMKLPFQHTNPPSTENYSESDMTLEELFAVADDDTNEKNENTVPVLGKHDVDINHNLTPCDSFEVDNNDLHDYYNIKNLDLSQINKNVDSHDYENTPKELPGKSGEDDQGVHTYENTKTLDLSTLARLSLNEEQHTNICNTNDQVSLNTDSRKNRYAYENTAHLNRDLPQQAPERTLIDNEPSPSYMNTKITDFQAPGANTSAPIYANVKDDSGYDNTTGTTFKQDASNGQTSVSQRKAFEEVNSSIRIRSDDNNPGYENTLNLNISKGTETTCSDKTHFDMLHSSQARTLTKTQQLVYEISQKRPSPIGMDETLLHDEDQYTCMDRGYPCANSNLDATFGNQNDGGFYVAMNQSIRDSEIYENETDDDCPGSKRDSCYEEVEFPFSQSRKEGDGSSKGVDQEELHYHEVDLSALALPCEGDSLPCDDVYEDIDMPETSSVCPTKPKPQRPPPPAKPTRHVRSQRATTKSEGEPLPFKTPPTSPPRVSSSLDSKMSLHSKTSKYSKSDDFEYFDEAQLHLAIAESLKGIKQGNIGRPPAPPPKKLNYVKVETVNDLPVKSTSKKAPTNYSEIVPTEHPKSRCKEDDMEYIDDCQLHFFDQETRKMEKKRKELRTIKGNPSNKDLKHESSKPSVIKEQVENGSCDSSQQINDARDVKTQIEQESCDASKPMKPLVPSRKRTTNTNEVKKGNSFATNVESTPGKPINTDSIKKRALLPPPKPKRLFLNNEKPNDNTNNPPFSGNIPQSPAMDSNSSQSQQKREGTKKKPLPLPRKKV